MKKSVQLDKDFKVIDYPNLVLKPTKTSCPRKKRKNKRLNMKIVSLSPFSKKDKKAAA